MSVRRASARRRSASGRASSTRRTCVRRTVLAVLASAVAVVALAACSGSKDASSAGGGVTTTTLPDVAVTLRATAVGKVLADPAGRTLYLYVPDGTGAPRCTDSCAGAWPPVPAATTSRVSRGVTARIGSVVGEGGRRQLTVGGRPVYRFGGDAAPGDVRGQGQGRVWFALDAAGRLVE